MTASIYYYSGTGNSLWAAGKLSSALKDTGLFSMRRTDPGGITDEAVGLVFPVHIWGLPRRVVDFVGRLPAGPSRYYFALAVNAGQVASTLVQLKGLMKARGLTLAAGYDIVMPSNYIPWGGAAPEEEQKRLFAAAAEKVNKIAAAVGRRETGIVEKGPLWQDLLLSGLCYNLSYSRIPKMDANFRADEKCNSCAICTSVCPCGDIILNAGRPQWQGHCEQCLACIQWCPLEAIQYGKKTPRYARYRHPEVTLQDMLK